MYALTSSELLDVWEAGRGRCHVERAVLLLRAACPELGREACLDMSIGERDARLLAMRAAAFGCDAALLATCRRCGERLEFELPLGELSDEYGPMSKTFNIEHGSYVVQFRLPTSRDLWSLRASELDLERAARELASRCLLAVEHDGVNAAGEPLPDAVLEAVAQTMQRADPRAYVTAALSCPACDYAFSEVLDVLSCLWTELSAHAVRTLREVHALASRYGWDELTVLRLSPYRRRLYLELASA